MKFFIFFFIFFISFNINSKSNDSPDLNFKSEKKVLWNEWISQIKEELQKEGFKTSTLKNLDNLKFNKRVIELDRKQPEFKLNFNQYLKKNFSEMKKKNLVKHFSENQILLDKIYSHYNVDPKILASLWGIETSYGSYLGKFDILSSLASLAYDGRRKNFFLKQLRYALKILEDGHISKSQFKGSWAGAFGQTQFMPSTFNKYAIDFDGNKKINLFKKEDALASGANYLKKSGWNNKIVWGEKIDIPITKELRKLSDSKVFKKIKSWEKYGIIFKNKYNKDQLMRLVIPDSEDNQIFLVSKNFDVILDWNRSNYFALTVFLLSDEIK